MCLLWVICVLLVLRGTELVVAVVGALSLSLISVALAFVERRNWRVGWPSTVMMMVGGPLLGLAVALSMPGRVNRRITIALIVILGCATFGVALKGNLRMVLAPDRLKDTDDDVQDR